MICSTYTKKRLVFALLILSVDFFECRAMGAQLYMNEDGLGARRFGKPKVFIKWNEIREVGTGSIPTPFGRESRIYFCDRVLDQAERDDLITLKYHTVHFSYIRKSWYPEMCKRLPTPIAAEFVERYVRSGRSIDPGKLHFTILLKANY